MTLSDLSDSCIFPSLNDTNPKGEKWGTSEIPASFTTKILEHCHQRRLNPSVFLSAVWSVLLCHYVDIKVLKIWTAGRSDQDSFGPAGKHTARAELRVISLTEKRTFEELLDSQLWSTLSPTDAEDDSNTGIVINDYRNHIVDQTVDSMGESHPLELQIAPDESSLTLSYRTTALSDFHAASLLDTVQNIANAAIENPVQSLGQLMFISQQDLTRIRTWNACDIREADCPMHEIIHKRAIDHPQAMAVDAWDGKLTYAELDRMTSHLAAQLMKVGVGPGTFVPLCFEKSFWAISAALAVNKTGGAFVPLDPALPIERVETIIKQTGASIILSSHCQAAPLRNAGYTILIPSELMSSPAMEGALFPDHTHQLSLPAYCLFTSGSTGTPKGCVMSHSSFASIVYHGPKLHIRPATRVLQFASLGFGISLIEVYCTLSCGGTTCIPSDAERMNSLGQAITSMKVEWATMTPTALDSLSPSDVSTLQVIIAGGEPIQSIQIARWAPKVRLFQAYGLTEWAGNFSISSQIRPSDSKPDVGFPINGRAWLVDPNDRTRLRSVGAIAELMIEGPNLAHGYLNNPKGSAASFLSPPYGVQAVTDVCGSRDRLLYATGDLVRYNLDGSIRHMGRKDGQIKIRGQRVEAAEVEFALRRVVPHVKEAVVDIIPTASNGLPSLAAFILGNQGNEINRPDGGAGVLECPSHDFLQLANVAKEELGKILPSYMIPAIFLPLRQSPRTVTGKTDRRRLRREAASLSVEDWKQYTTTTEATGPNEDRPLSATEQTLARIWGKLFHLDVDQIKPNDDFFALGGDSLVAMRSVAMARGEEISLKISDIFSSPRLQDLAQRAILSSHSAGKNRASVSAKNSSPRQALVDDSVRQACIANVCRQNPALAESVAEVLPATGKQEHWVQYGGLDCYVFMLEGEVDLDRMKGAFHAVVERHSILRTVLTQTSHGVFQVVLKDVHHPLRHITTNEDIPDLCTSICDDSTLGPACHFDKLATRLTLISGSASRHALIFRLTHTQIDAYCLTIVLRDFASAYEGHSLSPGTQFTDYTRHVFEQDQTSGYEFWRRYLEGSSIAPFGPFTMTTAETEVKRERVVLKLPYLPQPPAGVTTATLVKASWALVYAQISKQTDVVFGQIIGGRSASVPGIDNMVGPCQNSIPIRVHFQPSWTVNEYLRHVQEQYVKTGDYDWMDMAKIIRNSTSWDANTVFSCEHSHQNMDLRREIPFEKIRTTSFRQLWKRGRPKATYLFSVPLPDRMDLVLVAASDIMTEEQAPSILKRVADLLQVLQKCPDMVLAEVFATIRDEDTVELRKTV
nr:PlmK [Aspergillus flavipes]